MSGLCKFGVAFGFSYVLGCKLEHHGLNNYGSSDLSEKEDVIRGIFVEMNDQSRPNRLFFNLNQSH